MRIKRLLMAVTAATLLMSGLGMTKTAAAAEGNNAGMVHSYQGVWQNPFYEDLTDVQPTPGLADADAVDATGANEYSSTTSAANYIKKQMVARASQITFYFNGSGFTEEKLVKMMDTVLNQVCKVTANPREGDYLYYHLGGIYQYYKYTSSRAEVVWQVVYMSTAAQENVMNSAIKSTVSSLNLSKCSEAEKIKRIHDYICKNTKYYDDDTYYCHSAHAALKRKAAVCQGYSTLFYALCVQAGIEVRCIPGVSYGENHLWNIVKIGSKWYNIDTTWDSQSYGVVYDYFLKNDKEFYDHTRSYGYRTTSFYSKHPMTGSSYAGTVGNVTLKSVTSMSPTALKLTWAKVSTATGYEIYYATSKNGTYKKLKTISGGATTSCKATNLTPGTTYYFKLRAVSNLMGNSTGKYSGIKSGKPVPAKTNLTKLTTKTNAITAKWNKTVGAAGYEIVLSYKNGGKNISQTVTIKSGKIKTAKLTGLKKGKSYSVKIRAYAAGKGGKKVYGTYSAVKKKMVN